VDSTAPLSTSLGRYALVIDDSDIFTLVPIKLYRIGATFPLCELCNWNAGTRV
jgi:hypothetical protein